MTLTPRGILGGGTSEDGPGVKLTDGQEKLLELVHFPRNWPLARLTIPREGLASKLIGSLKDTAFKILASNRDPDAQWKSNSESNRT